MNMLWKRLVPVLVLSLTTCAVIGCGGGGTRNPLDGGVDASLDANVDVDAALDAEVDAEVDAGADPDLDAGDDAGTDVDAGADVDAGSSVGSDHLLFSEIVVTPTGSEFFEIWNPTTAAVDLSDYHIADNSAYTRYATGAPWAPVETAGTDFLVRFPAGTSIAAGDTLVIATNAGFETAFSRCPDFIVSATGPLACGSGSVPAMLAPVNGGVGASPSLSNDREMLVLFVWDGDVTHRVQDVDYVTWGVLFDDATRADKTDVAGYAADTPRASQSAAIAPALSESIGRCDAVETGEPSASGNGLTGHDETGEDLSSSFRVFLTPSPGAVNVCP